MILKNPKDKYILKQVASLHRENINKGFLSSLGNKFLRCLYKAISLSEKSILIVYIENNKVKGFISGTYDIKEIKNILKRKCFLIFFRIFLKIILNPRRLKKFIETYKYSSNDEDTYIFNINAELLSIAVEKDYRGKGIASLLYNELVKFFKENNIKEFKIIVGEKLKGAQKFYEKMGAKKIAEFELHKGEKSYIYLQKVN